MKAILHGVIDHYTKIETLMPLLNGLLAPDQTPDSCPDHFDCFFWRHEEDNEVPYAPGETAVKRAIAAEVVQRLMARADLEFPTPESYCECRTEAKCGAGSFCVDRVCVECRTDSDCGNDHALRAPRLPLNPRRA